MRRHLDAARYVVSLTMGLLAVVGAWLGGAWLLLAPVFMFVCVPVADLILGERSPRPIPTASALHHVLAAAWLPVHSLSVLALITLPARGGSLGECIGASVAVGMAGGISISAAHELAHARDRWKRVVGGMLLQLVGYPSFAVDHLAIHHRLACLPDDPSSARLGEGFYSYLRRALPHSIAAGWRVGVGRARSGGPSALAARFLVASWVAVPALIATLALVLGGLPGLALWLGQCAIAVNLLMTVAYAQHYGLSRRRLPDGTAERMTARHSWDAYFPASAALTFNLQVHADHHAAPDRPGPSLNPSPDAPRLPAGYPWMLSLAMIPPLWFRVMNPKVREASAAALREGP